MTCKGRMRGSYLSWQSWQTPRLLTRNSALRALPPGDEEPLGHGTLAELPPILAEVPWAT